MVRSQSKPISPKPANARTKKVLPPKDLAEPEAEHDIKIERKAVLLLMLVVPLSLAFYSFFNTQLAHQDWPLLPETVPPGELFKAAMERSLLKATLTTDVTP